MAQWSEQCIFGCVARAVLSLSFELLGYHLEATFWGESSTTFCAAKVIPEVLDLAAEILWRTIYSSEILTSLWDGHCPGSCFNLTLLVHILRPFYPSPSPSLSWALFCIVNEVYTRPAPFLRFISSTCCTRTNLNFYAYVNQALEDADGGSYQYWRLWMINF